MSEEDLERDVLARVGSNRRDFVKRVLLGGAFVAPVIASFDMNSALAQARKRRHGQIVNAPNGYSYYPNGYQTQSIHDFPYDEHHGDDPSWQ
jgi:hypothetical protein